MFPPTTTYQHQDEIARKDKTENNTDLELSDQQLKLDRREEAKIQDSYLHKVVLNINLSLLFISTITTTSVPPSVKQPQCSIY